MGNRQRKIHREFLKFQTLTPSLGKKRILSYLSFFFRKGIKITVLHPNGPFSSNEETGFVSGKPGHRSAIRSR